MIYEIAGLRIDIRNRLKFTENFCKNYLSDDQERKADLSVAVSDEAFMEEKAQVLTEAAGVKLGDIVSIDYSWGEIEFVSESVTRNLAMPIMCDDSEGCYDIDIEPDDIDVSDTVTVVWEIS